METPHLNFVDAMHVATVMEDSVDQLIILGRVMPGTFYKRDHLEHAIDDEIAHLRGLQAHVEEQFHNLHDGIGAGDHRSEDVRHNTQGIARVIKQSPIAKDNMDKLQLDRAFMEQILHKTAQELFKNATFKSLTDAVHEEKDRNIKLEQTIRKEADGRRLTKHLQKQLIVTKKEQESEIQKRIEIIAHLKDQLQEMKAKTMMESKYVKKMTDVNNAQTLKRCNMEEAKLEKQCNELKAFIDEENRVNVEIESYLRGEIDIKQQMLRDWADKYDNEIDRKQKELDILKAARAADIEKLTDLTRLYHEYEQVVLDDRIEKEKQRRKVEREKLEEETAIRIQAWWRGLMVRRCLGQYKPKKKKKGKKGDKKKKGK